MKKSLLIQILILITLSVGGCKLPTDEELAEIGAEPEPTTTQEEETTSESAEEEVEEEPETEANPPQTSRVPGLKEATNPNQFVQERGNEPGGERNDPFSLFALRSQNTIQPPPPEPEPVAPGNNNNAVPTDPTPIQSPSQPPPPPEPKLARAVQIQGAVKVGEEVTIIVKAPNEPTSRYVRPQQSIANGQVLVKSVNMNQQPTPTVVLEEEVLDRRQGKMVKLEVIKSVSEGVTETDTEEAETAQNQLQLPPPPPPAI